MTGGNTLSQMNYAILLERIEDHSFPEGYFYAHIPSLGLTTHGLGVDGGGRGEAGAPHRTE